MIFDFFFPKKRFYFCFSWIFSSALVRCQCFWRSIASIHDAIFVTMSHIFSHIRLGCACANTDYRMIVRYIHVSQCRMYYASSKLPVDNEEWHRDKYVRTHKYILNGWLRCLWNEGRQKELFEDTLNVFHRLAVERIAMRSQRNDEPLTRLFPTWIEMHIT